MAATSASEPFKPASTQDLIHRFGQLRMLDDLIRLRAADEMQVPILAYPSSEKDGFSYDYLTGQHLDRMVDDAVHALLDYGFKPNSHSIVALLTPSDLSMVATFFALSRMGYTVMMLSPRLSATACVALLDTVGCDNILHGQTTSIQTTMDEISQLRRVHSQPVCHMGISLSSDLNSATARVTFEHGKNPDPNRIALILHSSGTTGMPKPLYLSHRAIMTHPLRGPGLTSFNSLPWYHLHGLSTAFQAMWMRKTAFMWDASLPVTGDNLVKALEQARPESVHAVPYVLQLLADTDGGIEELKKCKLVTYGGAACPDELGDRLVREGVRFGGSFGSTEAGLTAESISRPPDDPFWNYLRFFDNIQPYVWMKPLSEENGTMDSANFNPNSLYECVFLPGHQALTTSNSDQPPGSFHSKDVFTPHPAIPGRWKYVTRLDDRITLTNGEKVLPLPIEGLIKQHPLIHDAVVVGVSRAVPGLLVFQSEKASQNGLSGEEYLDAIWPVIEEVNSKAEKFSQLSRDTVAVLPYEASSSGLRTDKGSVIRAQVYNRFADVIDGIYAKFGQRGNGTLRLSLGDTEAHILKLCKEELGLKVSSVDTDFFAAGVDSLKAIHLRRLLLRDFDMSHGKGLGQNIVFETATVSRLAEKIFVLQNADQNVDIHLDGENKGEDELQLISRLISRYSTFRKHVPHQKTTGDSKKSVILTGATGSIGIHTLVELLKDDTIEKVYCLTRRENPLASILETLQNKTLTIPESSKQKIIALKSNLNTLDLGLEGGKNEQILHEMRQTVSLIIHTAWPVNFQLPLRTFEEQIKGLYHLIQFSLDVKMPDPAVLMFCSSVSTAMKMNHNHGVPAGMEMEIPEQLLKGPSPALHMGYAQSKLIGEKIISIARSSANARTYSLRIGQVSGHSSRGRWNDSEAVPLMIRSALTMRVLPVLNETCSWIPVDILGKVIIEIARSRLDSSIFTSTDDPNKDNDTNSNNENEKDDTVYNICNPKTFPWSCLLAVLRNQGLTFTAVPFETWLALLRESEKRGEEHVNPAVKLIEHYDAMYSGDTLKLKFRTDRAERESEALRGAEMDVIRGGILENYVKDWLQRWT